MSEPALENTPAKAAEAGKAQPLEIIFSSAFAGLASLIKDPAIRSIAVLTAPPVGYGLVKFGRVLVNKWIEDRRQDAPIRLAKGYILDLEKEKRKKMSVAERRHLETRIKELKEVVHKLQLKQVELVQIIPPPHHSHNNRLLSGTY